MEIESVIKNPPSFIVFGQSSYAKSRIVNEIFGKNVFPAIDENHTGKLRMVKIYHGDTNTVSLTLPDDYDLVDNLEAYNGPWNTIPQGDLEVPDNPDDAKGMAVMEVTQNHSLLRFGTRVIISPTTCSMDSDEELSNIITKCIEDTTPIIIYGFTSDTLTEQVGIQKLQMIFFLKACF